MTTTLDLLPRPRYGVAGLLLCCLAHCLHQAVRHCLFEPVTGAIMTNISQLQTCDRVTFSPVFSMQRLFPKKTHPPNDSAEDFLGVPRNAEMVEITGDTIVSAVGSSASTGHTRCIAAIIDLLAKTLRAAICAIPQPSDTTHDVVRSRGIVLATSTLLGGKLARWVDKRCVYRRVRMEC